MSNDTTARDLRVIRQAVVILVLLVLGAGGVVGVGELRGSGDDRQACLDYINGPSSAPRPDGC